jgi:hypothetical protein
LPARNYVFGIICAWVLAGEVALISGPRISARFFPFARALGGVTCFEF